MMLSDSLTAKKWVNTSAIVYGIVVSFIKFSILLQYLRLFAPTRKGNMFGFTGAQLCIWINLIFYLVVTVFSILIMHAASEDLEPTSGRKEVIASMRLKSS